MPPQRHSSLPGVRQPYIEDFPASPECKPLLFRRLWLLARKTYGWMKGKATQVGLSLSGDQMRTSTKDTHLDLASLLFQIPVGLEKVQRCISFGQLKAQKFSLRIHNYFHLLSRLKGLSRQHLSNWHGNGNYYSS